MKKTFSMSHPKIKTARLYEAAINDIRKYMKRERRKELPTGVDFWDFDCKFGSTEEEAKTVHPAELSKCIQAAEKAQLPSFYVEVLAKPGHRQKKPTA
jgi:hypothetical protein